LGSGLVDWWPTTVREILWKPLGLAVGYQWLLLGVLVGMVIGGSQALARSLFAQITPGSRSGEFFSFFGFISRTSSVLGPILYIAATSLFDTRVAVVSILLIIVAGTILLRRVDVNEGIRVAASEEARTQDS
jgi:UMF1 family MFS transporter